MVVNDFLLPPPRYQDNKNTHTKRFRSKGELGTANTKDKSRASTIRLSENSRKTSLQVYTKKQLQYIDQFYDQEYFNIFPTIIEKVDEELVYNNLFGQNNLQKKRKTCSYCGDDSHFIRQCKFVISGFPENRSVFYVPVKENAEEDDGEEFEWEEDNEEEGETHKFEKKAWGIS